MENGFVACDTAVLVTQLKYQPVFATLGKKKIKK